MNRRRFLHLTAAAGAVVGFGKLSWPQLSAAERPDAARPTPSWVDKPMRWAQLTLVEDDPAKFDPQFWLDYFKRTRSDAVCLSAGGCVAYYPTTVPFHHRSAWLGERDVFGELVAGCRKLGLVVIARTDPHATYDEVQAAHPDWIAVGADGKPRRHWASPELWVTCGLGPYNFEFLTEVTQEIMSRYRVDAIFINRWDGSGMCYCEHCRRNFRAALWRLRIAGEDRRRRRAKDRCPRRVPRSSWRTSQRPGITPITTASCIATSNRPTCSSTKTANPTSRTLASRDTTQVRRPWGMNWTASCAANPSWRDPRAARRKSGAGVGASQWSPAWLPV